MFLWIRTNIYYGKNDNDDDNNSRFLHLTYIWGKYDKAINYANASYLMFPSPHWGISQKIVDDGLDYKYDKNEDDDED